MAVRLAFITTALAIPLLACAGSQPLRVVVDPLWVPSDNAFATTVLVVAQVPGTNEFRAYSKTVGKWNAFTFPPGIKAVPVAGRSCCVFQLEGEGITEVVAIDLKGNWCTSKLPAATAKCVPILAGEVAVIVVDGKAYGFSAEVGTWDSVPAATEPKVLVDMAYIDSPQSVAAFSAATGKWAVSPLVKEGVGVE